MPQLGDPDCRRRRANRRDSNDRQPHRRSQERSSQLTQVHGGNTWNVIPEEVVLRGTCSLFQIRTAPSARDGFATNSEGVVATHGVKVAFATAADPPAVNAEQPTEAAARAPR